MDARSAAALLAGVALLFLALAGREFSRRKVLYRRGVVVEGTCTSQYIEDNMDVSTIAYSHRGREYTFTTSTPTSEQAVRVGLCYPVRYDPEHPRRAALEGRGRWDFMGGVMLATVFLAVAALVLFG
ncbi:DUF3592 domain-containing protein [Kitasatospora sp. NPDC094028]